jgi:serum/glucocorticoid-regulated kinase 2
VITLHIAFQTPQNLYLALDHCPHGDLAELITVRERLSEGTARFVIAQVLLAVEYLHSRNILYRDLKPENILIASDRYVRLTDFGLSRENCFSMSFCGSPAYLSPEMLERKGVGFASDIYGVGCILFEMLVGEPPFFDENIDTLYENIRTGKLRYPSYLSIEAKSIISKLLERDVNKRLGVKNFSDIKAHDFFKKMDWTALLERRVQPPLEMVL